MTSIWACAKLKFSMKRSLGDVCLPARDRQAEWIFSPDRTGAGSDTGFEAVDKYEFGVSVDEINRLIGERRFQEAAEIADTIDWTRVRGAFLLCKISDLYKINKRYQDSRDLLEIAYERKPASSKIIYSLCELELKLNNYIHALQLYNAFINVAPRDSDRFLLQYKLYKKQDVNVLEQIAVLEEFLRHDFREKWAYELAGLYLKAGDEQSCVRLCDEIVAYFGDGRFVIRALELKKSITPLTPQQEDRLEILLSGGTIAPPAPEPEDAAGETGDSSDAAASAAEKASEEASEERAGAADDSADVAGADDGTGAAEDMDAAGAAGQTDDGAADTAATEVTGEDTGAADLYADPEPDRTMSAGSPEQYTDELLRDAGMQETIARGMREIGDYDKVLAQETSGQLTMVMEEEPQEETQVEGQLDLEQIMSEWEKIRRDSEQQRLAEARRRVLERSDAVKRELYGDGAADRTDSAGAADPAQDSGSTDDTRSWNPADVKKGLK